MKGSDITMNKNRPKTMLIRLSEAEYKQVKSEIESSGMTQQEYLLTKVISPKNDGDITQEIKVVTPVSDNKIKTKICPECGAPMEIKNGYRGKFWGCTRFPQCRHTEDWTGE